MASSRASYCLHQMEKVYKSTQLSLKVSRIHTTPIRHNTKLAALKSLSICADDRKVSITGSFFILQHAATLGKEKDREREKNRDREREKERMRDRTREREREREKERKISAGPGATVCQHPCPAGSASPFSSVDPNCGGMPGK